MCKNLISYSCITCRQQLLVVVLVCGIYVSSCGGGTEAIVLPNPDTNNDLPGLGEVHFERMANIATYGQLPPPSSPLCISIINTGTQQVTAVKWLENTPFLGPDNLESVGPSIIGLPFGSYSISYAQYPRTNSGTLRIYWSESMNISADAPVIEFPLKVGPSFASGYIQARPFVTASALPDEIVFICFRVAGDETSPLFYADANLLLGVDPPDFPLIDFIPDRNNNGSNEDDISLTAPLVSLKIVACSFPGVNSADDFDASPPASYTVYGETETALPTIDPALKPVLDLHIDLDHGVTSPLPVGW